MQHNLYVVAAAGSKALIGLVYLDKIPAEPFEDT